MSDKVKLPKCVAEAIDTIKRDLSSEWKHHVLRIATATHCYMTTDPQAPIRTFSDDGGLEKLIGALYIGYEVEQTREDKVREYYKKLNKDAIERDREKFSVNNQRNEMQGIINTLKLLDIKIEGINT